MLSTYILVEVLRVEAKPDLLFAFWGFLDVTYDPVYPVGWLLHGSDDVVCDHFVKFLFVCVLEQCAVDERLGQGHQLIECGTSLPGGNLACQSNLGTLPKQWAWIAGHVVPKLLSWLEEWY